MAGNDKFVELARFYNQLAEVMAAICVQKGGIAQENYVGRFFAADVLQFIAAYGQKSETADKALVAKFMAEAERTKDLATPSAKPIYEMTLAEFEKVMNI
jgi:hypothetical protein